MMLGAKSGSKKRLADSLLTKVQPPQAQYPLLSEMQQVGYAKIAGQTHSAAASQEPSRH
jgi:hypothetical protein